MDALLIDLGRIGRPLLATAVGLVVFIVLATALQISGLTILWTFIWLSAGGATAVGLFLIVVGGRPLAGAGAILAAVSIVLAFVWRTPPAGVSGPLASSPLRSLSSGGPPRTPPRRASGPHSSHVWSSGGRSSTTR